MIHQLSVAGHVLQIADQAKLKKDYGVDALLAARSLIRSGHGIEEIQIEDFLQPSVKIDLRNPFTELETAEEFY